MHYTFDYKSGYPVVFDTTSHQLFLFRPNEGIFLKTPESDSEEQLVTNNPFVSNGSEVPKLNLATLYRNKPGRDTIEQKKCGYRIFPNPSTGILYIEFEEKADMNFIKLYAIDGRLKYIETEINSKEVENFERDLSYLDPGLYIIQLGLNGYNKCTYTKFILAGF